MVKPSVLYRELSSRGIEFYAGVPDSLLKNFCSYIDDTVEDGKHITAANEGNAVALAAGYYLASQKPGCVYMQNSGLGNSVNPLASLTDSEVYKIPMLLIVGWRGEPGVKDEPQHIKQGRITPGQLDLLDIPYQILEANSNVSQVLDDLFQVILDKGVPAALLVRKNTFEKYTSLNNLNNSSAVMKREEALSLVLEVIDSEDLIVSTTGKTSRELFELRAQRNEEQCDFLTVGSMGHTSSIAMGAALANPGKRIVCLDGDGSLIMHMGAMPVIGQAHLSNLVHVLLNNGCHESVGGQRTVADKIDFAAIAGACGYTKYYKVKKPDEIKQVWADLANQEGPFLVEVNLKPGSRDNLGRPSSSPEENKNAFIRKATR